jgi:molybdopterin-guanine dinucleotide biosynthesis protein A
VSALVAVLAGGRGRRMGGAKALAPLGGRPLISWPLEAASAAGLRAVVVAKADTPLPELDVPVWREPAEPVHPLLGVVVALERADTPVVALPCDMPFVPGALLARLAAGPEASVGAPFPARYEPAALPGLRAAVERGVPVRATLEGPALDVTGYGDPARILASVNTPDELAAAEAALA